MLEGHRLLRLLRLFLNQADAANMVHGDILSCLLWQRRYWHLLGRYYSLRVPPLPECTEKTAPNSQNRPIDNVTSAQVSKPRLRERHHGEMGEGRWQFGLYGLLLKTQVSAAVGKEGKACPRRLCTVTVFYNRRSL